MDKVIWKMSESKAKEQKYEVHEYTSVRLLIEELEIFDEIDDIFLKRIEEKDGNPVLIFK